jgi:hypothetical protein
MERMLILVKVSSGPGTACVATGNQARRGGAFRNREVRRQLEVINFSLAVDEAHP